MSTDSREEILRRIRKGLHGSTDKNASPKLDDDRAEQGSIHIPSEFLSNNKTLTTQFIEELRKISGNADVIENEEAIKAFILRLILDRRSNSFAIWESDLLQRLNLRDVLQDKGLKSATANNKEEMAEADIGITEADFAIADSGTLVLFADERQPRSVSLIPPVHVAILKSNRIVANIHDLFAHLTHSVAEMGSINDLSSCVTFITGPSRTADIELNLTLGVHGPKEIFVLVYN